MQAWYIGSFSVTFLFTTHRSGPVFISFLSDRLNIIFYQLHRSYRSSWAALRIPSSEGSPLFIALIYLLFYCTNAIFPGLFPYRIPW